MPKILHDPQHPTYSTSRCPLPRSPLISMLHLREVMQDLGHSRKPFFWPVHQSNIKIKSSREAMEMLKVMQDFGPQP